MSKAIGFGAWKIRITFQHFFGVFWKIYDLLRRFFLWLRTYADLKYFLITIDVHFFKIWGNFTFGFVLWPNYSHQPYFWFLIYPSPNNIKKYFFKFHMANSIIQSSHLGSGPPKGFYECVGSHLLRQLLLWLRGQVLHLLWWLIEDAWG